MRKLADEKGDIKALDRELEGYFRLRVRSYRILFRYVVRKNKRIIACAFAEHPGVVYEVFLRVLSNWNGAEDQRILTNIAGYLAHAFLAQKGRDKEAQGNALGISHPIGQP